MLLLQRHLFEKQHIVRIVMLSEAKNPERVAAYCHVLQDVD
jgi:hypothetical protein